MVASAMKELEAWDVTMSEATRELERRGCFNVQKPAQHTGGPWVVEHADGKIYVGPFDGIGKRIEAIVATFPPKALANAHLVAAAPDMKIALKSALEALKTASSHLSGQRDANASGRGWAWMTIARIECAIASSENRPLPKSGEWLQEEDDDGYAKGVSRVQSRIAGVSITDEMVSDFKIGFHGSTLSDAQVRRGLEAVFAKREISDVEAPVASAVVLEEQLWSAHNAEHAKLGEMLADKNKTDVETNWQGGKVNGIATAIDVVRASGW